MKKFVYKQSECCIIWKEKEKELALIKRVKLTLLKFTLFFKLRIKITNKQSFAILTPSSIQRDCRKEKMSCYILVLRVFLTAACCPKRDFYTHTPLPPLKNGNRLLYNILKKNSASFALRTQISLPKSRP